MVRCCNHLDFAPLFHYEELGSEKDTKIRRIGALELLPEYGNETSFRLAFVLFVSFVVIKNIEYHHEGHEEHERKA